jgi:NTP pyrophosphatase (non-canonical NTP hydrolase)
MTFKQGLYRVGSITESVCVSVLNDLAEAMHEWEKAQGFVPNPPAVRNPGEQIALMHSELSEMLEWIRKPRTGAPMPHPQNPDLVLYESEMSDHLPDFTGEEEEAADMLIRLLNYCAYRKLRIGQAIMAKMEFNESRPHKHGKNF